MAAEGETRTRVVNNLKNALAEIPELFSTTPEGAQEIRNELKAGIKRTLDNQERLASPDKRTRDHFSGTTPEEYSDWNR